MFSKLQGELRSNLVPRSKDFLLYITKEFSLNQAFLAQLQEVQRAILVTCTRVISSPEPKAQGEPIVYQSSRRLSVCLSVCVSVDIFKLEYLRNQLANRNEILSEPSLGWGKGCIRFWARSDRNSGVHGNG